MPHETFFSVIAMLLVVCGCSLIFLYMYVATHLSNYQVTNYLNELNISRHTVVCQRPRKPCESQVLFTGTTNLPFSALRISITTGRFLLNSHILCPPYTRPYIPNLKEISPVVCEMCSRKLPYFLNLFLLLRTVLQK